MLHKQNPDIWESGFVFNFRGHPLFIIYYLLFIIYYLLFIIYYLLFTIYYLLFIIYYLLFEKYGVCGMR
jgi:hypothetical protein